MFNTYERPITVAVHPKLIEELKFRKEFIEKYTGRRAKGGLTTFSETAAMELKAIRESGNKIMSEIMKIMKIKDNYFKKISDMGIEREYVPFEIFKKMYILCSVLNRKKDHNLLKMEVTKIRGLDKNEIIHLWEGEAK